MTKPPNVIKVRARSAFEAQILISILKNAGVTVFDRQDLRSDEFAMAQRLMHQTGVEILVPEDQAEAARNAIDAARAKGEMLTGDVETEDDEAPLEVEGRAEPPGEAPRARGVAPVLAWIFLGTSLVCGYEWLETRRLMREADAAGNLAVERTEAGTTRYRLRKNGMRVCETTDKNGNGIAERTVVYWADGSEDWAFDDDEDGRPDRKETHSRDGVVVQRLVRDRERGWVEGK